MRVSSLCERSRKGVSREECENSREIVKREGVDFFGEI
jgi:hypothetical protein